MSGADRAWTWPTRDPYVTSGFSTRRWHPVLHVYKAHTGADFRAHTGAELIAAHAGTVVRSGYYATPGNYVRIDCGGGVWVGYSHLSERLVSVGDRVAAGQVIGRAGSTGTATAAHLHFEISVADTKVDPIPYLAARLGLRLVHTVGLILTGAIPDAPTTHLPDPLNPEDDMQLTDKIDDAGHTVGDALEQIMKRLNVDLADIWDVTQEIDARTRTRLNANSAEILTVVRSIAAGDQVDEAAIARALAPMITGPLVEAIRTQVAGPDLQLSEQDITRLADAVVDDYTGRLVAAFTPEG